MDALRNFPEWLRLPVAEWVRRATAWVIDTFEPFFERLHWFLRHLVVNTEEVVVWVPWVALVVAVAGSVSAAVVNTASAAPWCP